MVVPTIIKEGRMPSIEEEEIVKRTEGSAFDKKETEDEEKHLTQDTSQYEEDEPKEENKVTWRTTLIDKIKSFFSKKCETKPDEKNRMTFSSLIDKVKVLLNLKTEDAIDQAYEKAKAERDFINLHNMGNKQFQKKDLDRAIEAYEKALKIKEDKGTSFKLELAKVQKEKEEKKQAEKDDNKDLDKDQTPKDKPKKDKKKKKDGDEDKQDSKKEKKSKKKKDDKE